mmetsp:Transcript_10397/g.30409  ORF Transcript_10397/g.30409 Transcript_10397/m.30409 type:complete len:114 (+) Transcript_10397:294-635(+)
MENGLLLFPRPVLSSMSRPERLGMGGMLVIKSGSPISELHAEDNVDAVVQYDEDMQLEWPECTKVSGVWLWWHAVLLPWSRLSPTHSPVVGGNIECGNDRSQTFDDDDNDDGS